MPTPYTVYRFIAEEQRKYPVASGDFSNLLRDFIVAVKEIHQHVRLAGLGEAMGELAEKNSSGDMQKKLDVMANDILVGAMVHGGHLCAIGSEEEESLVPIPDQHPCGDYVLLFDPLDGSGNANIGLDVGTIFSIRKRISEPSGTPGTLSDVLRPGTEQVAAGYVLYGASTHLVFTTGNGVHHFTYDPSIGEFLLTNGRVQLPDAVHTLSVNFANRPQFTDAANTFCDSLIENGAKFRWMKCMVADVHSALMEGGVFFYPPKKDGTAKLRLLYEVHPMAMVFEQAGGAATDGEVRLLDKVPKTLHEKSSVLLGPKSAIEQYQQLMKEHARLQ